MNKTNLQHFKQAVDDEWARLSGNRQDYSHFDTHFVIMLFAESRKCRMSEGPESLLRNTARAIVTLNRHEFDDHFRKAVSFFQWEEKDYILLATEIEREAMRLKGYIERWLYNERRDLFCRPEHRDYLWSFGETTAGGTAEDHPMKTFHLWLDYLDQMKRVDDFDTWFRLKRNIVDCARVGHAVIPRSEWEPICTVLPSFCEQVQS